MGFLGCVASNVEAMAGNKAGVGEQIKFLEIGKWYLDSEDGRLEALAAHIRIHFAGMQITNPF